MKISGFHLKLNTLLRTSPRLGCPPAAAVVSGHRPCDPWPTFASDRAMVSLLPPPCFSCLRPRRHCPPPDLQQLDVRIIAQFPLPAQLPPFSKHRNFGPIFQYSKSASVRPRRKCNSGEDAAVHGFIIQIVLATNLRTASQMRSLQDSQLNGINILGIGIVSASTKYAMLRNASAGLASGYFA